ncbi:hypothetical protein MSHO_40480 [Mycobacterium shottsii]|uniref:Uncharacterized protein n=1 Tax=Mycobacterium shottsii TaxID=133549 RepID=A0A7I7LH94_9MYCO|nr:hypothetical protein MSHO_40480 [Mycobacterium shottsii]
MQLEWEPALEVAGKQLGRHLGTHVMSQHHHRSGDVLGYYVLHQIGLFQQVVAVRTGLGRVCLM